MAGSTNAIGRVISSTFPLAVGIGGTGQTTYTNGQLLIGNSTGSTLTKATLTGTANQINVTNGTGSITLSTPQNIATASSPSFAGLTLSGLTANSVIFAGTGGVLSQDNTKFSYNSTNGKLSVQATGSPVSAYDSVFFQLGPIASDIATYNASLSPMVVTTKTNNGGSSVSAAEPVEVWMRQGITGQAYANIAEWSLARSSNSSGTSSNTILSLGLTGGTPASLAPVIMTWNNETGNNVLKTNINGVASIGSVPLSTTAYGNVAALSFADVLAAGNYIRLGAQTYGRNIGATSIGGLDTLFLCRGMECNSTTGGFTNTDTIDSYLISLNTSGVRFYNGASLDPIFQVNNRNTIVNPLPAPTQNGNGCLVIGRTSFPPTTASNCGVIYVDASGNLWYRGFLSSTKLANA